MAWVNTSIPVSAVIAGGTLTVRCASNTAMSGSRLSSTSGYFIFFSWSDIMENLVTSDPVPLVVGIAIDRHRGSPAVLTAKYIIPFAVSIAEPPPKEITVSGLNSSMIEIPFITNSISGLGTTSENT